MMMRMKRRMRDITLLISYPRQYSVCGDDAASFSAISKSSIAFIITDGSSDSKHTLLINNNNHLIFQILIVINIKYNI